MARLKTPTDMDAAQTAVHDAIADGPRGAVVGPLGVWLHRAALADRAQKLGQYCRYDSSLDPRLSELAILTTARIWDAPFEWQSHEEPARKAGLPEAVIDALRHDREPDFEAADERVVHAVTLVLNQTRTLPDDLYAEALAVLGKDALVDLIGVLGYYTLISMTIKAFDVDPIPGVPHP